MDKVGLDVNRTQIICTPVQDDEREFGWQKRRRMGSDGERCMYFASAGPAIGGVSRERGGICIFK